MAVPKTAALPLGYAPTTGRPESSMCGLICKPVEKHNRGKFAFVHSVAGNADRTPRLAGRRNLSRDNRHSLSPYGQFVAGGISEVKSASAREGKDRLDDLAAGVFDRLKRLFQVFRIEHR
jgi:hypothetical protein